MHKIIIIGGGFAGLSAAEKLSHSALSLGVTLIDRKDTFDFLPTIPDILGRGISPDCLRRKINDFSKRFKFSFIKGEVSGIDLEKRELLVGGSSYNYEYFYTIPIRTRKSCD